MSSLPAFNDSEKALAKRLLATRVCLMMGRKFEEADWSYVYCTAKGIPEQTWSNLHIDVMHDGLGIEHKMLCVGDRTSLLSVAGTTLMHPAATRSIRIASLDKDPNDVMRDVFTQYASLIGDRYTRVARAAGVKQADVRVGWVIWERSLTEFLYFEEPMIAPDPKEYWAEWNEIAARGSRKPSKNLWIYDKKTRKKRYSVTTAAGIKIQPYFDVPPPKDENLYWFRVQGEELSSARIRIWITRTTARDLKNLLGTLTVDSLSNAIREAGKNVPDGEAPIEHVEELAEPIELTREAYSILTAKWTGVGDEHRIQLLVETLRADD